MKFFCLFHIIISFSTFVEPSSITCLRNCTCSSTFTISCPTREGGNFSIKMEPEKSVEINCNPESQNLQHADFNLLKSLHVGQIMSISFTGCRFPENKTLGELTEPMDVHVYEELKFRSYQDPNKTFHKKHITGFEHVEILDLSYNDLMSLPSDLLDGFHNLKKLWLGYNSFHNLPLNFFSFVPTLKYLSFKRTNLVSLEDGHFANLTRLKYLDLREAEFLENIAEDAFSDLTNLISLRIYFNDKIETLPDNLFRNLTKLRILEIGRHNITSISPALSRVASKLVTFRFSRNLQFDISEDILSSVVKNLKDRDLDLSTDDRKVRNLQPDFLVGFRNLKWLDLGGNNIYNLSRNFFSPTPKLEFLSMRKNRLTNLPDGLFDNLTELKRLELRKNNLASLPENIFTKLKTLEELDISRNELQTFPVGFFKNLKKLRKLDLTVNNFTQVSGEVLLPFASTLESFELGMNKQNLALSEYFLSNFTALKEVRLHDNKICSIPETVFWYSMFLKTISLRINRLKSLPKDLFRDQIYLEELDLRSNELEHIPEFIFRNLARLQILQLQYNRLQNIPRDVFHGLQALKIPDLSHNQLKYSHSEAFRSLEELSFADLSHNLLSFQEDQSPFRYSINLESLKISNNSIGKIFKDWRVNLKKLQYFDLSYNKITRLSVKDIDFIGDAVPIDLTSNNITVLDFGGLNALAQPFGSQKRKIKLAVGNNPLHCDCGAYDFIRYLKNPTTWPNEINFIATFDSSDLMCQQPESHRKVLARNIDLKDLTC